MKRRFFPAFVAVPTAAALLSFAACDPDLTPHVVPGEGGPEAGASDAPITMMPGDSGGPSEGGPGDGGMEAGPKAHEIDGTNDFAAGEKFTTTSAGYDGYVAWDATKVYFGMSGMDVGVTSAQKWVLIYVDGNPGNAGTTTGIAYDCGGTCTAQQANLPFAAGYHLRWKADGNYTNLQKWNGSAWVDAVANVNTVERKNNFMEVSLLRSLLGSPTKLKFHMTMLIEASGVEWTYAGVPSTSFTDGKAPAAFTKYFEFDLSDTAKAPNSYATKP